MAIHYYLEPFHNNIDKEGKQGVYPQLVRGKTITTTDLAKEITQGSSFTEGDVLGILRNLTDLVAFHLKLGSNVNLQGIGTLSLTASLKDKNIDPDKIRSSDIGIKNICFRPAPLLKQQLSDVRFKRVKK